MSRLLSRQVLVACVVSVLLGASSARAQTDVGGVLTTNATWMLAGSPYRLTDHVRVSTGVTLTVEPGVVVEAVEDFFIDVSGTLRAEGTAAQPITFRKAATNGIGWLGLRFLGGSVPYDAATGQGSVVAFATIRDMSYSGTAVSLVSSSPRLSDLEVVNYRNGGLVGSARPGSTLWVQRNRIHDGSFSPLSLEGGFVAEGNELYNNNGGQNCLVSLHGGIFRHNFLHDNPGTVLAACAGPGAVIESNTIVNNGGIGVALRSGTGQMIRFNTIGGHTMNLMVIGWPNATIQQNNFIGTLAIGTRDVCGGTPLPRQYHVALFNATCGVFGGTTGAPPNFTLDLASNYWSATNLATIADAIRDSQDDLTILGTVNTTPSLNSPRPQAGAVNHPVLGVVHVEPSASLTTGGTAMRVFGHAFQAGASLAIGGVAASDVAVLSPTLITATLPPGAAGAQTVTVTNPDFTAASLAAGVRYLEPAGDADADGVSNEQELTVHASDPLAADTDGDGVPDGVEIGAGANPLSAGSIPGATVVGGVIGSHTTWTLAGSPYRLTNHVRVAAGATLTIDPGVVVEAAQDFFLEVAGTLRAEGTAAQPITFQKSASNGTGWIGLRFLSNSVPYDAATGQGSVVAFATIRDMSYNGAAVNLQAASPRLSDLEVVNYRNGGLVGSARPGAMLWVQRNRIHDGGFSPFNLGGGFIAEGNELYNNNGGQNCLASVHGGTFRHNFLHDNSGTVLAVCAGPGAVIESNTIVNNGGIGVVLRDGSGQVIRFNTIGGHTMNLMVIGTPNATIQQNNFIGTLAIGTRDVCGGTPLPRQYHVALFNGSCGVFGGGPFTSGPSSVPFTLDLASNYWSSTDAATIAAAIRDSQDDLTILGTVVTTPSLISARPQAGAVNYPVLGVVHSEPAVSLTTGGTAMRVFGHAFQGGAGVTVGGVPATDVVVLSPTLLTATLPPGAEGAQAVTVTNPDFTSGSLLAGVRYLDPAGDADADGISNEEELTVHGSDPLATDSDGDGATDGAEIAAGTNPRSGASIPGATIVGGVIGGNATWTLAGSPYRLTNHVQVAAGATLTIDPGVVVEAAEDFFLEVAGTLRAAGTAAQRITFRKSTANGTGWLGLRFLSNSVPYDAATGQGSVVAFATIRDMSYYGAAVNLQAASPRLSDLEVVNYRNGGLVGSARPGSILWVQRNRIHDGSFSPFSLAGGFIAEGNELYDNNGGQNCLVSLQGGTFRHNFLHDNSGTVLAVCAGPGAVIESNTIVNNGGIGVALRDGAGQVIRFNTIGGHSMNLMVIGWPNATIQQNNFIGPLAIGTRDVCGGTPISRQYHVALFNATCGVFGSSTGAPPNFTLDLASSYWSTTDSAAIADAIRDSQDDLLLLGTVNASPFLTDAIDTLPIANAGVDQVLASGGTAQLDGSASFDADGDALQYSWYQTSGPSATLLNADTSTPILVASTAGPVTLALVVHDGRGGFGRDTVVVTASAAQATPTIAWGNPGDIVHGTPLSGIQLNATASVPGTFVYTPPPGSILGIGNAQPLLVLFIPFDTTAHSSATATVLINVLKMNQVVSWSAPEPIVFGTALGATQLNATANVPGTFVYSPPAGTVLSIGAGQTLRTTFTPFDLVNYTAVNLAVVIDVVAQSGPRLTIDQPVTFVQQVIRGSGFPANANCTLSLAGMMIGGFPTGSTGAFAFNFGITAVPPGFPRAVTLDCNAGSFSGVQSAATSPVAMSPFGVITFDPVFANSSAVIWGFGLPGSCPFVLESVTTSVVSSLGAAQTGPGGSFGFNFGFPAAAENAQEFRFRGLQSCAGILLSGQNPLTPYPRVINLKPSPIVTWPTPAPILAGTPLGPAQLNATANMPGTFVYLPPPGTVLPLGNGRLITVVFIPSDSTFANVTRTVAIDVVSSVVTWNAPANILVGTPLGAAQLNATANVPGSFVYSPPAGTVLGLGNGQLLSVTFTPNVPGQAVITKTVAINVVGTSGQFQGRVVDAVTGAPVANATITAHDVNGYPVAAVSTDATGNYLTPALATGPYYAKAATSQEYVDEVYRELACVAGCDVRIGTRITVALNAVVPGIDFTLSPLASVAGAVKDPAGLPMPGVAISIFRANATLAKTVSTGADGRYAATGLPTGEYFARATNPTGQADVLYDQLACAVGCDVTTGTRISVSIGQVKTADFQLPDASEPRVRPSIIWPHPAAIPQGAPLGAMQLSASSTVPGVFVYTPPAGTILSAGGGQVLSVTFTPTETATYAPATATVTIDVGVSSITWPVPADIVYGTLLSAAQLNATTTVPGTFAYVPPAGTRLNAGSGQLLTVTFTPFNTASFPVASTSVPINVLKAVPLIGWTNAANIAVGTPLSGVQLNASASVPGTFVYAPSAGTILALGNGQVLSVTFTPTDSLNYATVTTTRSINVIPNSGQFGGRVVDAVSGQPLGNATVTAHDLSGAAVATATTDPTGHYVTPPLAPGSYYAKTTAADHVDELYRELACIAGCDVRAGTRISVTLGTTFSGIDFTLGRMASITGTIVGVDDQPITGIDVSVFDAAGTLVKTGTSDVSGRYAANGLPTGTYFARTNNSAGYADVLYDGIACVTGCDVTAGTLISTAIGLSATANFRLADNTPAGNGVVVVPRDPTTGATPVAVTFTSVLAPGRTTVTTSITPPALPHGYSYGEPAIFFDLSTTSTFAPPLTVCVSYAGSTFDDSLQVRLLHVENNVWEDRTTSLDPIAQVVCGVTTSLSPFAVTERKPVAPVIAWSQPNDIVFGTPLGPAQLNATVNAPGTLSYAPPAGTVLSAGSGQALVVTFTPADPAAHTSATATVSINVLKAVPVIEWSDPAPIQFGTALSSAQLSASVNVPGTLVYDPPAGTVLPAGDQQVLTVTVSPSDPANYEAVSRTVMIDVRPAPSLGVTVLTPNGLEPVRIDQPFTITWSTTGAPQEFDVYLSRNGGASFMPVPECIGRPAPATSCSWLPTGPPTTDARIQVVARGAGGQQAADTSDADFTIDSNRKPKPASIKLRAPKPSASWTIGTVGVIEWEHTLPEGALVRIDLSRDSGATWTVIAPTVANADAETGRFSWVVTGPATSKARLRVSWTAGTASDTTNGGFDIEAPGGKKGPGR